ncbi:hypothetical protein VTK26DRAFT_4758 [Humicola hyalothermophila]
MSLLARDFFGPDDFFPAVFRVLDEFNSYTQNTRGGSERPRHRRHLTGAFNPRFDVRETETAYELHGELPGVERDQVNIEFTDPQTLVIRGRSERTYTSGTPPAGLVEGGPSMSGAIKEKGEETQASGGSEQNANNNTNNSGQFEKYWVQERSIGEFARTFSFPARVDQDTVSASLNNGVLSLIVPKVKKHETRRIAIN